MKAEILPTPLNPRPTSCRATAPNRPGRAKRIPISQGPLAASQFCPTIRQGASGACACPARLGRTDQPDRTDPILESAKPGSLGLRHGPRYSLRKHLGFWSLTFEGQKATFDHAQGAFYVAYLLLNPPSEPIHGMALELKANAYFRQRPQEPCATLIVHPGTGEDLTVASDAVIVEHNLCVDENEGLAYLRRKVRELEAIAEDDTASEPVKAEVQRELEELYAYQKKNQPRTTTAAQKAVRAVRWAMDHFYQNLAEAVVAKGNPHPVLRRFAAHLQQYLVIPTARYCKQGGAPTIARVPGCFTYEPPAGVKWVA